jgi:protoheme IX farnesyltransferase
VKQGIALQETRVRTSSFTDYVDLTKPRITLLVVLTGAVGYFMASRTGLSLPGLLHSMFGIALVSASAGVLNQVMERDADAKMTRTANRPIPAGRVSPESGLVFGTVLGLGGVLYTALFLNMTVALLAAVTLGSYIFIYTPLKRVTTLNTLVGAIPGALPPVGGWAAATGMVSREAGVLFLIVFIWQIPHFLAIAWLYREDYARAGLPLLPVIEPDGRTTGRQAVLYAMVLVPASLTPVLTGLGGLPYAAVAVVLGSVLVWLSTRFARDLSTISARRLFLASIVYLPVLWAVLVANRLWP